MSETYEQMPDGTWRPAVPEPFWIRRWFRSRPQCFFTEPISGSDTLYRICSRVFKTRDQYEEHYRREHIDG